MQKRPAALLLLAMTIVFWPAVGGTFVYDDVQLIVRNPALQNGDLVALLGQPLYGSVQGLEQAGYWRPLTSLLLWLGNRLGGAAGIHVLALLLHAAATLVAFQLGQRLFGNARPAFWLALLFALHPVQVESAAWCSAINDPLWGLFTLLAMHSGVRWALGSSQQDQRSMPWLASLYCLGALLSKENAIATAPLVLVAITSAPRDPSAPSRVGRAAIAVTAGLAVWWLLRALVFGELTAGLLRPAAPPSANALQTLTAPAELLVRHLALLVWPHPLTPCRSLPAASVVTMVLSVVLALGIGLGCLLGWRRLAGPTRLAIALLLVPLVPPLLSWQSLGSYPIADRYLYLPALGFALALAPLANTPRTRLLPGLLAATFGVLSFVQTWAWHDPQRFVQNALQHAANDPTLLVMAGDQALLRAQQGDPVALATAQSWYATAERLAANERPDLLHRALAPARLGLAWCMLIEQQGRRGSRTPALLAAFQRAVDTDPTSAPSWVGLGVANGIAGANQVAERAFQKALELDPGNPEARHNLSRLRGH